MDSAKPISCIYHGNCPDGFGAAWAIWRALGDEVVFYPGIHGDEPPDVSGTHVIIVDFSYSLGILEKMAGEARSVLLLDHHQSAMEALEGLAVPETNWLNHMARQKLLSSKGEPFVFFDMERSGAKIAWDFFHPGIDAPLLLQHIEDRDLWRFKMPNTHEILAALYAYPYDFDVWDKLMVSDVSALVEEGRAIERRLSKDLNEFISIAKSRMIIGGFDVPVLNAPYFWAAEAGQILSAGEAFSASYFDTQEDRVFSLRSNDAGEDVSKISTAYGGGGHRNAAGFKMPRGWEGD